MELLEKQVMSIFLLSPILISGRIINNIVQPLANSADDYDMPWEYKNKLPIMGKPPPFHPVNIVPKEIDPNTPLDQQRY